jgi:hypothetical protein
MIINIRGTSGSGKSTLVRKVMECYPIKSRVKEEGRKQPIGYILAKALHKPLALVGHYETDCGGCDTINNMDDIYNRVRLADKAGYDVLFEGLLISADANRAVALHTDALPVLVIALNTPLEQCLASVNQRRREAWERRIEAINAENDALDAAGRKLRPVPEYKGDVNPKNTMSKFAGVKSSMKRLEAAGVANVWLSRDEALARIKQEFAL